MKNKEKRITHHIFISIVLLFLAVFVILILTQRENYARQMQQVDGYIDELSGRTAHHVGDVLQDKLSAVTAIADLYDEALKESSEVWEPLKKLEDTSGFDRIRFVRTNGLSYASDGKSVNVSDRPYFKDAIQGGSGITGVMQSYFDGKDLIGFYAPVRRNGKTGSIIGVLVGFLEKETVSDILETELYDYPADTMILNQNGTVLGRYEDGAHTITSIYALLLDMDKDTRQTVMAAMQNHEKVKCSFMRHTTESLGYLVPIDGTDWFLLQLFPQQAINTIIEQVNFDERFALMLFAIVCAVFIARLVYLLHKKNEMTREHESRDRVQSLLQNVANDYICLIDVNLQTGMEEQFRISDGETEILDWAHGNFSYENCIKNYAETVVCEPYRAEFISSTKLPVLKEILAKQKYFYLEYDGEPDGTVRRLQSKFTLNSAGDHMLAGIRDITDVTREKIRTQTSIDLIVTAASTVYPFILEENLTRDVARTVRNQNIVKNGRIAEWTIDGMLEDIRETVPFDEDYALLLKMLKREAQLDAYARGERELSMRMRQLGDDGQNHWMETRNILMKNAAGEVCCVSLTRCVDDEIARTAELERAKDKAESANRAKSTFLFNMSHDIRTPMNAIMGFTDMAEKYADDPEKVRDCLQKVHVSGEYLLKLINNVLDMARIESGRLEIVNKAYHVPTVFKDLSYIFAADAENRGLTLHFDCRVQDEIVIYDRLKVNQIELNLIGNAMKYTPKGGTVWYTVEQTGREDGYGLFRLTVRDTGIGMSEEFCKKVFDAFERENTGTVAGTEGSGLGLAITKRLVDILGGTITCESAPGEGSTFICDFRFKLGTEKDLEDAKDTAEEEIPLAGRRVLLVEDNALNREISRDILESEKLIVEEACDGAEAVEKVKTAAPGYFDVVLMDIQMPNMNGYEAAKAIRALPDKERAEVPILAVTANAFEEDRKAALAAGMNGHVPKPISLDTLKPALQGCLKQ